MLVDPGLEPTRQTTFVDLGDPGLQVSASFVFDSSILQAPVRELPQGSDWLFCQQWDGNCRPSKVGLVNYFRFFSLRDLDFVGLKLIFAQELNSQGLVGSICCQGLTVRPSIHAAIGSCHTGLHQRTSTFNLCWFYKANWLFDWDGAASYNVIILKPVPIWRYRPRSTAHPEIAIVIQFYSEHVVFWRANSHWFPLSLRSCVTTNMCSKQWGFPDIPLFCTEVSKYLFFRRNSVRCQDKMLKNIVPSMLSSEIVDFLAVLLLGDLNALSTCPLVGISLPLPNHSQNLCSGCWLGSFEPLLNYCMDLGVRHVEGLGSMGVCSSQVTPVPHQN